MRQRLTILNETRQKVLAAQAHRADNIFTRLRGLLFRAPLKAGQGLLLIPCNGIHCIGMTYAIDVIFLDRQYLIVGLVENLKPGQLSAIYPRAHSCLELLAGVIADTGTQIGDRLTIQM